MARSRDELARTAWDAITTVFLSGEMHDRFHEAADSIDLPHPGSLKALMLLPDDAAPSMREMAEVLRCDPSYVTSMTDALEQRGYAERQVSSADRRVKLLHITESGIEARERARRIISTPPPGLGELTTDELRTLADLLTRVVVATDPT